MSLSHRIARSRSYALLLIVPLFAFTDPQKPGPASTSESHYDRQSPTPDQPLLIGNLALGKPKGMTDSFQWQGSTTSYSVDHVLCNGVDIGRLDFVYQAFTDTGFISDFAGAALEGGFSANSGNPCPDSNQKPGVEYFWIQIVSTNVPPTGRPSTGFVDAEHPRDNPQYPDISTHLNPNGQPFTGRSVYDGPKRKQQAGQDVQWSAELMLCCRNGGKINVIGSFTWGFSIPAGNPADHSVSVTANSPGAWLPPTADGLKILAAEVKGTDDEKGWSIEKGCCCEQLQPTGGSSSTPGNTSLDGQNLNPNMLLDGVIVFPRTKPVTNFVMPPAPGWQANAWPGGNIAPPLSYETTGATMYQQGIFFTTPSPVPAPATYNFHFQLQAHESFLDVFFHDRNSGRWLPYAMRTQQLLGDMNGDLTLTGDDLAAWDLAFSNPAQYAATYPGLDRVFAGDMNHNGNLDPTDRNLLQLVIGFHLEIDAVGPAPCGPGGLSGDVNGDDVVDLIDAGFLISQLLNLSNDLCELGRADMNSDGLTNGADLQAFIRAMGL